MNSTLRIQSKQQWIKGRRRIPIFCFPIDYWIMTIGVSSERSSGNHGTISSSTSFEQSPELGRKIVVSIWDIRGMVWNAALTDAL